MKERRDLGYFFKRGPSKTHGGIIIFPSQTGDCGVPKFEKLVFPVVYGVAWSK